MKRLLQNGIARDVGIFAGIGVVAMTLKNMQKPPLYENLNAHPRLKMSPFAKILNTLHALNEPQLFEEILNKCTKFLEYTELIFKNNNKINILKMLINISIFYD